jgi:hypothetical protein
MKFYNPVDHDDKGPSVVEYASISGLISQAGRVEF